MSVINPKTIQIFLPFGNPRGMKIAEVTNRTVQAILIPRNQIDQVTQREEISSVGLYFLFGEDEETSKPQVYIGEAENCSERLKQHHKSKDFWTTAVVIVTNNKQNQFTKTDVKFLENHAYHQVREAKRFFVDQTIPTQSFVPEWRQADLFDIFGTMKLLLSTLGYPVFESLRAEDLDAAQEGDRSVFYCKGRGIIAKGELTDDGFVVFEGSEMVLEPVESFKQRFTHHMARIEQMIDDGVVIQRDNQYIFQTDYLFNSPSMAADCILKRSSNGWVEWKDASGRTLDEVKRKV